MLLLEEKVDKLSRIISENQEGDNNNTTQSKKMYDSTKYFFNGMPYGKGRLVLAIVKQYCSDNPQLSAEELISTFNPKLQGSLGVVKTVDDVKRTCKDYIRRFFFNENDIIHTQTHDCVVCNQWGKFNIDNLILRARELGYTITTTTIF